MSGRFYPGTRPELERTVREHLAHAVPAPRIAARGALVPHAAYQYSGDTAGSVFSRLTVPPLVVILAPNHTGICRAPGGASVWEAGAFSTPLGDVAIDERFAAALLEASPLAGVDHAAHRAEHAVEVELPFLQYARPEVRIVPLVLAWDGWTECQGFGLALARLVQGWSEPVLLLASSDLSHYEPASVAEEKDREALEAVEALDGEGLLARCRRRAISMCGRAPTAVVSVATRALGARHALTVDYRHSGWVTGEASAVVGYGGVLIP